MVTRNIKRCLSIFCSLKYTIALENGSYLKKFRLWNLYKNRKNIYRKVLKYV